MRAPQSLKQQFLKKWMMGLQVCDSAKQNMSILERKKAIKLSADIAIASTRNSMTKWSRAIMEKALRDNNNGNNKIVDLVLAFNNKRPTMIRPNNNNNNKRVRSKKILKKIHRSRKLRRNSVAPQMGLAKSLARKIVKKRTQVLKSLVPGGEFMDDISLIEETLDYIMSLRTQVDVMRTLAKATEIIHGK
ncbi:hypothetical protein JCGZ_04117 [Jatropha curcas]|uniref:IBH1-like N-terminal domain-containing protein n=1 Tax=Jatropha curcas TaxID=180498 RepID=A0A067L3X3_JATCU|nr:transcription factor IBH1-like 1 [Jatropha curcas]KDP38764.1 hypothetical protein JCGZ_04117 [Jatropha curcas]